MFAEYHLASLVSLISSIVFLFFLELHARSLNSLFDRLGEEAFLLTWTLL